MATATVAGLVLTNPCLDCWPTAGVMTPQRVTPRRLTKVVASHLVGLDSGVDVGDDTGSLLPRCEPGDTMLYELPGGVVSYGLDAIKGPRVALGSEGAPNPRTISLLPGWAG